MSGHLERISAPGIPQPVPQETAHLAEPHLPRLPHDGTLEYSELLDLLRRDLQLDLSTEVQGGTKASLLNLGIARGVAAITFAAGTTSSVATITHGLAATPSSVVAVALGAPSFTQIPTLNVFNVTSTSFQVNGAIAAAFTGSINFYWVALL